MWAAHPGLRPGYNPLEVHRDQCQTVEPIPAGIPRGLRGRRFYHPELDALRLFAFLAVLIHHGAGRPGGFVLIRGMGGFGLSLFFVLSAYLITGLLLREKEEHGTVHLKSFYIRRVLRIWPLYYTALLLGFLIGKIPPHTFSMEHTAIAGLALFVMNWLPIRQPGLCGPMWSISIEEQFYLVWPLVAKIRGRTSVLAFSAVLIAASAGTLAVLASQTWMLWYNTFVEFLFFGTGAILALVLKDRQWNPRPAARSMLLLAGLAAWGVGAGIGGVGTDRVPGLTLQRLYIGYGAADLGCIAIFVAFLGANAVPRAAVYLGKISYGLYVFHYGMIRFSEWIFSRVFAANSAIPLWGVLLIDSVALAGCVAMASVSYSFLEKPFLRLKDQFAFVPSRPPD